MSPECKAAVDSLDQIICANCIYSTGQTGNGYFCNNLALSYAPTGDANVTFCAEGRWLLKTNFRMLVASFDTVYEHLCGSCK